MPTIAGYEIPPNLNTPTSLQAEATRVQREFEQALLPIRADTTLTAEGKKRAIAGLFAPIVEEVMSIQRRETDRHERALARTEAEIFGASLGADTAGVVSSRDAFDRAESLPRDKEGLRQGKKLLERAEKTNDEALVRAVLVTALERGWADVVDDFRRRNTDLGPALDRYVTLREYDPSKSQLSFYTYKITAPYEVATTDPARLRAIAAGDGENKPSTTRTPTGPTITAADRREFERSGWSRSGLSRY